jgi:hypothetical protein
MVHLLVTVGSALLHEQQTLTLDHEVEVLHNPGELTESHLDLEQAAVAAFPGTARVTRQALHVLMTVAPADLDVGNTLELAQSASLLVGVIDVDGADVLDLDHEAQGRRSRTGAAESVLEPDHVAKGPLHVQAASVLELAQDLDTEGIQAVFATSALALDHDVDVRATITVGAESTLAFEDRAFSPSVSLASELALAHAAEGFPVKRAVSVLELDQTLERFKHEIVESVLVLDQNADLPLAAAQTLVLAQAAVFVPPPEVRFTEDDLTLVQTVRVEKTLHLAAASGIDLDHAPVALPLDRSFLCRYHPFGDLAPLPTPDDPAFTKGVRLKAGADVVTLNRSANLGDIERFAFDRINQEARGGTLVVFADPQWPKIRTLLFTASGVKRADAHEVLRFFSEHLGEEVELTTHEGYTWAGVITNPEEAVVEDRRNQFTVSLEIERRVSG